MPWQAQGNSAQPGQTPLGAVEAAASFGGIEQEQDLPGMEGLGGGGGVVVLKSSHASEAEPSLPSRNTTHAICTPSSSIPLSSPPVTARSLPTVPNTLSRAFNNLSWCMVCSLCSWAILPPAGLTFHPGVASMILERTSVSWSAENSRYFLFKIQAVAE